MMPAPDPARPLNGNFRQDADARTYVFAAFGVMCRGGRKFMRPFIDAPAIARMKLLNREAKTGRISADFVERNQRTVTIQCSILEALGHDRTGQLLKVQCKA